MDENNWHPGPHTTWADHPRFRRQRRRFQGQKPNVPGTLEHALIEGQDHLVDYHRSRAAQLTRYHQQERARLARSATDATTEAPAESPESTTAATTRRRKTRDNEAL